MADTVTKTVETHGEPHDDHHHDQSFWSKYIFSTDHKVIGAQYMLTGVAMALIGGFMAYVFRMQLAFPDESVPFFGRVSAMEYNSLVTNHGTIMIFWQNIFPAPEKGKLIHKVLFKVH